MKNLLVILLFLSSACNGQFLRPQASLINQSCGESNTGGGYARNSLAPSDELLQRRARIFQRETGKFDRLHIAASNNYGSFDSTHGVELQLANDLDSGYFGDYNLYLIKSAQGSTKVHDWMPGSTLFNRMVSDLNTAIDFIYKERGVVPVITQTWSLGINDGFAGLSAANFKDSLDIILDTLQVLFPGVKQVFTKFNQPSYTTYNTTFDTIKSERSTYVETVYDSTAELRADDTHWDYAGWKKLGAQVTTKIMLLLSL